ncbi:glycosyltransferase [Mediterraneibacter gnavus]|uniref:glycosyltransferase n=1 Tax=Mediterraneibacter gnavus TaxID=33038 RepID=UPI001184FDB2|nr:glycosyltransferase [Mediterraneibacter gnavus]
MKRVLVTGGANIGRAGVATIVYKWGQEFDSNKLVYDYLMQRGLPAQQYVEAIVQKGGKVFTMEGESRNLFSIIKWVEEIIRENKYDTIHINTDTAYIAAAYIYAAKKGGIRHIFVHSHCTQVDDNSKLKRSIKTLFHRILVPYVCKNSERYLACSKLAGYWMFGKKNVESNKYKTIYNGVVVESYLYNEQVRKTYREQMGLSGKLVIGNIGRFSYQKNHKFLIEVFTELSKTDGSAVLVLVGTGELESQLKALVNEYGITDKVFFLGTRMDVPLLLSMFDVLVMPSRFEGLPVTIVEAQMNSLPCIVADSITREAQFTETVNFITGWGKDEWVGAIRHAVKVGRLSTPDNLFKSKFNIHSAARELQQLLLELEDNQ